MSRTADCPQNIWQAKFREYPIVPFTSDKLSLRYQRIDDPAFWWHNPLNPNSLRLTRPAFNMLEKAQVPNWKFKLDRVFIARTYVQLEKHFSAPYFVFGQQTIHVYGETEAMMLGLHGSNLQQYLDNHDTHG